MSVGVTRVHKFLRKCIFAMKGHAIGFDLSHRWKDDGEEKARKDFGLTPRTSARLLSVILGWLLLYYFGPVTLCYFGPVRP